MSSHNSTRIDANESSTEVNGQNSGHSDLKSVDKQDSIPTLAPNREEICEEAPGDYSYKSMLDMFYKQEEHPQQLIAIELEPVRLKKIDGMLWLFKNYEILLSYYY